MATIVSFFINLFDWIQRILIFCWNWLIETIADFIEPFLEILEPYIPDLSSAWGALSPIAPYTRFLNQWIALDFALSLFSTYLAYIFVMITIKLIVKLFIPTVG